MSRRFKGSGNMGRSAMTIVRRLYHHFQNNPDAMKKVIAEFPDKVKDSSGRVSFTMQATAMYYALRDPHTSIKVKAMLAAALAYFIMPFDLIPDWIVGLGFTDDFAVVVMVLRQVSGSITQEHYDLARRRLQGNQESP